jgi:protein disulfide-isomerase A1
VPRPADAPWCGHCKQLAPIWDELAEHFASDDDVVIAKMDATKNEVDGVQVTGFPTLKLCMKETNEMIDYTGGRTLEDLIEFLEAQVAGEGEEEEEGEGEEEEEQEEDAAKKDEL